MLTAQLEDWSLIKNEMIPHFEEHYLELALNKDKVPLSPQYDEYDRRNQIGMLMLITLRKDSQLIGYFVGFVAPGLHYSTCLTLHMDIFFINPEHRDGSPMGSLKLFREAEREARRRGVQRVFVGSKVHRDASRLFEHLKYEKVETIYSKWIGE